jgi:NADH:ubiquinone oxidoreductase subunit 6 (subunit J)
LSGSIVGNRQQGVVQVIQVLFVLIAAIGLAAALGTILARNLVRAALYLVAFFFMVACQFVLLEAEFLAALQVLVYIGAVAIILMFGIMLTRNIQGDDPASNPSSWRVPGLIAGLGVFVVLAFGITYQKGIGTLPAWSTTDERPPIAKTDTNSPRGQAVNDMAKVAGTELMTRYLIGFEVAGLLLTVALVGAIAIAHRDEVEPARAPGTKESNGEVNSASGSDRAAPERAISAASSSTRGEI